MRKNGIMMDTLILKWSCPDAIGLLSRITGLIAAERGNLLDVGQFTDATGGWFFARLAFAPPPGEGGSERLRVLLGKLADEVHADWNLRPESRAYRAAILVSREAHCLLDLLWRWRSGELNVEIPVVISNHEHCRNLVEREDLEFVRIPFEGGAEMKQTAFKSLAEERRARRIDLVVLARFMQILPDWFCEEFAGRVINIHHSFLPAFVGANPYRRAFERGVKLIGATCHYATAELDAGPIIEQEVARVEHYHEPDDLVRLGRDCERLALARGVRFHLEDRVLLHGTRAIVFRD